MLTEKERIEKFCSKCWEWIDEEEADLTNDLPHCCIDKLGLVTMECEYSGKCEHFKER